MAREVQGNLFAPPDDVDVVCITTNGDTRRDGAAVMGRGVARAVKALVPGIEYTLGRGLRAAGNRPYVLAELSLLGGRKVLVASLPVKRHWHDRADLVLIEQSLTRLAIVFPTEVVAFPRPGCGNGHLDWAQVAPIVHQTRPEDRFVVLDLAAP